METECKLIPPGNRTTVVITVVVAALLFGVLVAASCQPSAHDTRLSAYVTALTGRTPNQSFNARRAAQLVDGSVIEPGRVFSFNNRVGGWSFQQGYRRAPVSYNGILIDEFGGGVCQTSTTVYNAALLAGLTIVERHSHTFAPGYVTPGRDAAVAYQNVDLRLKNPYAYPVTLHALVKNGLLICGFTARKQPKDRILIVSRTLDVFAAPLTTVQPGTGHSRARWHLKGRDGVRVATIREYFDQSGNMLSDQLVSDNTYQGISAVRWSTAGQ